MYEVNAKVRESEIKGSTRRAMRREGGIPAVLCDRNGTATNIYLDRKEVHSLVKKRGASGLVKLNIEGLDACDAIFKNIQYDYTGSNILHLDFDRAYDDKKIKIKVPLKCIGTPYGVLRQGGVLQQNAQETEIQCFPKDIPDAISIDVSELKLNEIVRAKDIKGYTFSIPSQSFFTVASSRAARKIAAASSE